MEETRNSDIINKEFDVEFHPVYLSTSFEDLVLSYASLRTKRPSRPESTEEILVERVVDVFDEEFDKPHNQCGGDDEEG